MKGPKQRPLGAVKPSTRPTNTPRQKQSHKQRFASKHTLNTSSTSHSQENSVQNATPPQNHTQYHRARHSVNSLDHTTSISPRSHSPHISTPHHNSACISLTLPKHLRHKLSYLSLPFKSLLTLSHRHYHSNSAASAYSQAVRHDLQEDTHDLHNIYQAKTSPRLKIAHIGDDLLPDRQDYSNNLYHDQLHGEKNDDLYSQHQDPHSQPLTPEHHGPTPEQRYSVEHSAREIADQFSLHKNPERVLNEFRTLLHNAITTDPTGVLLAVAWQSLTALPITISHDIVTTVVNFRTQWTVSNSEEIMQFVQFLCSGHQRIELRPSHVHRVFQWGVLSGVTFLETDVQNIFSTLQQSFTHYVNKHLNRDDSGTIMDPLLYTQIFYQKLYPMLIDTCFECPYKKLSHHVVTVLAKMGYYPDEKTALAICHLYSLNKDVTGFQAFVDYARNDLFRRSEEFNNLNNYSLSQLTLDYRAKNPPSDNSDDITDEGIIDLFRPRSFLQMKHINFFLHRVTYAVQHNQALRDLFDLLPRVTMDLQLLPTYQTYAIYIHFHCVMGDTEKALQLYNDVFISGKIRPLGGNFGDSDVALLTRADHDKRSAKTLTPQQVLAQYRAIHAGIAAQEQGQEALDPTTTDEQHEYFNQLDKVDLSGIEPDQLDQIFEYSLSEPRQSRSVRLLKQNYNQRRLMTAQHRSLFANVEAGLIPVAHEVHIDEKAIYKLFTSLLSSKSPIAALNFFTDELFVQKRPLSTFLLSQLITQTLQYDTTVAHLMFKHMVQAGYTPQIHLLVALANKLPKTTENVSSILYFTNFLLDRLNYVEYTGESIYYDENNNPIAPVQADIEEFMQKKREFKMNLLTDSFGVDKLKHIVIDDSALIMNPVDHISLIKSSKFDVNGLNHKMADKSETKPLNTKQKALLFPHVPFPIFDKFLNQHYERQERDIEHAIEISTQIDQIQKKGRKSQEIGKNDDISRIQTLIKDKDTMLLLLDPQMSLSDQLPTSQPQPTLLTPAEYLPGIDRNLTNFIQPTTLLAPSLHQKIHQNVRKDSKIENKVADSFKQRLTEASNPIDHRLPQSFDLSSLSNLDTPANAINPAQLGAPQHLIPFLLRITDVSLLPYHLYTIRRLNYVLKPQQLSQLLASIVVLESSYVLPTFLYLRDMHISMNKELKQHYIALYDAQLKQWAETHDQGELYKHYHKYENNLHKDNKSHENDDDPGSHPDDTAATKDVLSSLQQDVDELASGSIVSAASSLFKISSHAKQLDIGLYANTAVGMRKLLANEEAMTYEQQQQGENSPDSVGKTDYAEFHPNSAHGTLSEYCIALDKQFPDEFSLQHWSELVWHLSPQKTSSYLVTMKKMIKIQPSINDNDSDDIINDTDFTQIGETSAQLGQNLAEDNKQIILPQTHKSLLDHINIAISSTTGDVADIGRIVSKRFVQLLGGASKMEETISNDPTSSLQSFDHYYSAFEFVSILYHATHGVVEYPRTEQILKSYGNIAQSLANDPRLSSIDHNLSSHVAISVDSFAKRYQELLGDQYETGISHKNPKNSSVWHLFGLNESTAYDKSSSNETTRRHHTLTSLHELNHVPIHLIFSTMNSPQLESPTRRNRFIHVMSAVETEIKRRIAQTEIENDKTVESIENNNSQIDLFAPVDSHDPSILSALFDLPATITPPVSLSASLQRMTVLDLSHSKSLNTLENTKKPSKLAQIEQNQVKKRPLIAFQTLASLFYLQNDQFWLSLFTIEALTYQHGVVIPADPLLHLAVARINGLSSHVSPQSSMSALTNAASTPRIVQALLYNPENTGISENTNNALIQQLSHDANNSLQFYLSRLIRVSFYTQYSTTFPHKMVDLMKTLFPIETTVFAKIQNDLKSLYGISVSVGSDDTIHTDTPDELATIVPPIDITAKIASTKSIKRVKKSEKLQKDPESNIDISFMGDDALDFARSMGLEVPETSLNVEKQEGNENMQKSEKKLVVDLLHLKVPELPTIETMHLAKSHQPHHPIISKLPQPAVSTLVQTIFPHVPLFTTYKTPQRVTAALSALVDPSDLIKYVNSKAKTIKSKTFLYYLFGLKTPQQVANEYTHRYNDYIIAIKADPSASSITMEQLLQLQSDYQENIAKITQKQQKMLLSNLKDEWVAQVKQLLGHQLQTTIHSLLATAQHSDYPTFLPHLLDSLSQFDVPLSKEHLSIIIHGLARHSAEGSTDTPQQRAAHRKVFATTLSRIIDYIINNNYTMPQATIMKIMGMMKILPISDINGRKWIEFLVKGHVSSQNKQKFKKNDKFDSNSSDSEEFVQNQSKKVKNPLANTPHLSRDVVKMILYYLSSQVEQIYKTKVSHSHKTIPNQSTPKQTITQQNDSELCNWALGIGRVVYELHQQFCDAHKDTHAAKISSNVDFYKKLAKNTKKIKKSNISLQSLENDAEGSVDDEYEPHIISRESLFTIDDVLHKQAYLDESKSFGLLGSEHYVLLTDIIKYAAAATSDTGENTEECYDLSWDMLELYLKNRLETVQLAQLAQKQQYYQRRQQYIDSLYHYVKAQTQKNAQLLAVLADPNTDEQTIKYALPQLTFLSKHNANLIGFIQENSVATQQWRDDIMTKGEHRLAPTISPYELHNDDIEELRTHPDCWKHFVITPAVVQDDGEILPVNPQNSKKYHLQRPMPLGSHDYHAYRLKQVSEYADFVTLRDLRHRMWVEQEHINANLGDDFYYEDDEETKTGTIATSPSASAALKTRKLNPYTSGLRFFLSQYELATASEIRKQFSPGSSTFERLIATFQSEVVRAVLYSPEFQYQLYVQEQLELNFNQNDRFSLFYKQLLHNNTRQQLLDELQRVKSNYARFTSGLQDNDGEDDIPLSSTESLQKENTPEKDIGTTTSDKLEVDTLLLSRKMMDIAFTTKHNTEEEYVTHISQLQDAITEITHQYVRGLEEDRYEPEFLANESMLDAAFANPNIFVHKKRDQLLFSRLHQHVEGIHTKLLSGQVDLNTMTPSEHHSTVLDSQSHHTFIKNVLSLTLFNSKRCSSLTALFNLTNQYDIPLDFDLFKLAYGALYRLPVSQIPYQFLSLTNHMHKVFKPVRIDSFGRISKLHRSEKNNQQQHTNLLVTRQRGLRLEYDPHDFSLITDVDPFSQYTMDYIDTASESVNNNRETVLGMNQKRAKNAQNHEISVDNDSDDVQVDDAKSKHHATFASNSRKAPDHCFTYASIDLRERLGFIFKQFSSQLEFIPHHRQASIEYDRAVEKTLAEIHGVKAVNISQLSSYSKPLSYKMNQMLTLFNECLLHKLYVPSYTFELLLATAFKEQNPIVVPLLASVYLNATQAFSAAIKLNPVRSPPVLSRAGMDLSEAYSSAAGSAGGGAANALTLLASLRQHSEDPQQIKNENGQKGYYKPFYSEGKLINNVAVMDDVMGKVKSHLDSREGQIFLPLKTFLNTKRDVSVHEQHLSHLTQVYDKLFTIPESRMAALGNSPSQDLNTFDGLETSTEQGAGIINRPRNIYLRSMYLAKSTADLKELYFGTRAAKNIFERDSESLQFIPSTDNTAEVSTTNIDHARMYLHTLPDFLGWSQHIHLRPMDPDSSFHAITHNSETFGVLKQQLSESGENIGPIIDAEVIKEEKTEDHQIRFGRYNKQDNIGIENNIYPKKHQAFSVDEKTRGNTIFDLSDKKAHESSQNNQYNDDDDLAPVFQSDELVTPSHGPMAIDLTSTIEFGSSYPYMSTSPICGTYSKHHAFFEHFPSNLSDPSPHLPISFEVLQRVMDHCAMHSAGPQIAYSLYLYLTRCIGPHNISAKLIQQVLSAATISSPAGVMEHNAAMGFKWDDLSDEMFAQYYPESVPKMVSALKNKKIVHNNGNIQHTHDENAVLKMYNELEAQYNKIAAKSSPFITPKQHSVTVTPRQFYANIMALLPDMVTGHIVGSLRPTYSHSITEDISYNMPVIHESTPKVHAAPLIIGKSRHSGYGDQNSPEGHNIASSSWWDSSRLQPVTPHRSAIVVRQVMNDFLWRYTSFLPPMTTNNIITALCQSNQFISQGSMLLTLFNTQLRLLLDRQLEWFDNISGNFKEFGIPVSPALRTMYSRTHISQYGLEMMLRTLQGCNNVKKMSTTEQFITLSQEPLKSVEMLSSLFASFNLQRDLVLVEYTSHLQRLLIEATPEERKANHQGTLTLLHRYVKQFANNNTSKIDYIPPNIECVIYALGQDHGLMGMLAQTYSPSVSKHTDVIIRMREVDDKTRAASKYIPMTGVDMSKLIENPVLKPVLERDPAFQRHFLTHIPLVFIKTGGLGDQSNNDKSLLIDQNHNISFENTNEERAQTELLYSYHGMDKKNHQTEFKETTQFSTTKVRSNILHHKLHQLDMLYAKAQEVLNAELLKLAYGGGQLSALENPAVAKILTELPSNISLLDIHAYVLYDTNNSATLPRLSLSNLLSITKILTTMNQSANTSKLTNNAFPMNLLPQQSSILIAPAVYNTIAHLVDQNIHAIRACNDTDIGNIVEDLFSQFSASTDEQISAILKNLSQSTQTHDFSFEDKKVIILTFLLQYKDFIIEHGTAMHSYALDRHIDALNQQKQRNFQGENQTLTTLSRPITPIKQQFQSLSPFAAQMIGIQLEAHLASIGMLAASTGKSLIPHKSQNTRKIRKISNDSDEDASSDLDTSIITNVDDANVRKDLFRLHNDLQKSIQVHAFGLDNGDMTHEPAKIALKTLTRPFNIVASPKIKVLRKFVEVYDTIDDAEELLLPSRKLTESSMQILANKRRNRSRAMLALATHPQLAEDTKNLENLAENPAVPAMIHIFDPLSPDNTTILPTMLDTALIDGPAFQKVSTLEFSNIDKAKRYQHIVTTKYGADAAALPLATIPLDVKTVDNNIDIIDLEIDNNTDPKADFRLHNRVGHIYHNEAALNAHSIANVDFSQLSTSDQLTSLSTHKDLPSLPIVPTALTQFNQIDIMKLSKPLKLRQLKRVLSSNNLILNFIVSALSDLLAPTTPMERLVKFKAFIEQEQMTTKLFTEPSHKEGNVPQLISLSPDANNESSFVIKDLQQTSSQVLHSIARAVAASADPLTSKTFNTKLTALPLPRGMFYDKSTELLPPHLNKAWDMSLQYALSQTATIDTMLHQNVWNTRHQQHQHASDYGYFDAFKQSDEDCGKKHQKSSNNDEYDDNLIIDPSGRKFGIELQAIEALRKPSSLLSALVNIVHNNALKQVAQHRYKYDKEHKKVNQQLAHMMKKQRDFLRDIDENEKLMNNTVELTTYILQPLHQSLDAILDLLIYELDFNSSSNNSSNEKLSTSDSLSIERNHAVTTKHPFAPKSLSLFTNYLITTTATVHPSKDSSFISVDTTTSDDPSREDDHVTQPTIPHVTPPKYKPTTLSFVEALMNYTVTICHYSESLQSPSRTHFFEMINSPKSPEQFITASPPLGYIPNHSVRASKLVPPATSHKRLFNTLLRYLSRAQLKVVVDIGEFGDVKVIQTGLNSSEDCEANNGNDIDYSAVFSVQDGGVVGDRTKFVRIGDVYYHYHPQLDSLTTNQFIGKKGRHHIILPVPPTYHFALLHYDVTTDFNSFDQTMTKLQQNFNKMLNKAAPLQDFVQFFDIPVSAEISSHNLNITKFVSGPYDTHLPVITSKSPMRKITIPTMNPSLLTFASGILPGALHTASIVSDRADKYQWVLSYANDTFYNLNPHPQTVHLAPQSQLPESLDIDDGENNKYYVAQRSNPTARSIRHALSNTSPALLLPNAPPYSQEEQFDAVHTFFNKHYISADHQPTPFQQIELIKTLQQSFNTANRVNINHLFDQHKYPLLLGNAASAMNSHEDIARGLIDYIVKNTKLNNLSNAAQSTILSYISRFSLRSSAISLLFLFSASLISQIPDINTISAVHDHYIAKSGKLNNEIDKDDRYYQNLMDFVQKNKLIRFNNQLPYNDLVDVLASEKRDSYRRIQSSLISGKDLESIARDKFNYFDYRITTKIALSQSIELSQYKLRRTTSSHAISSPSGVDDHGNKRLSQQELKMQEIVMFRDFINLHHVLQQPLPVSIFNHFITLVTSNVPPSLYAYVLKKNSSHKLERINEFGDFPVWSFIDHTEFLQTTAPQAKKQKRGEYSHYGLISMYEQYSKANTIDVEGKLLLLNHNAYTSGSNILSSSSGAAGGDVKVIKALRQQELTQLSELYNELIVYDTRVLLTIIGQINPGVFTAPLVRDNYEHIKLMSGSNNQEVYDFESCKKQRNSLVTQITDEEVSNLIESFIKLHTFRLKYSNISVVDRGKNNLYFCNTKLNMSLKTYRQATVNSGQILQVLDLTNRNCELYYVLVRSMYLLFPHDKRIQKAMVDVGEEINIMTQSTLQLPQKVFGEYADEEWKRDQSLQAQSHIQFKMQKHKQSIDLAGVLSWLNPSTNPLTKDILTMTSGLYYNLVGEQIAERQTSPGDVNFKQYGVSSKHDTYYGEDEYGKPVKPWFYTISDFYQTYFDVKVDDKIHATHNNDSILPVPPDTIPFANIPQQNNNDMGVNFKHPALQRIAEAAANPTANFRSRNQVNGSTRNFRG